MFCLCSDKSVHCQPLLKQVENPHYEKQKSMCSLSKVISIFHSTDHSYSHSHWGETFSMQSMWLFLWEPSSSEATLQEAHWRKDIHKMQSVWLLCIQFKTTFRRWCIQEKSPNSALCVVFHVLQVAIWKTTWEVSIQGKNHSSVTNACTNVWQTTC